MKRLLAALLAVCALPAVARPQIKELRGINAQGDLYQISGANGSGTLIASSGLSGISAMARRDDWNLYVLTWNGGSISKLYTLDAFNGQTSLVTNVQLGNIRALAFKTSTLLYAVNDPSPINGPDDLYTIDLTTGNATLVGPIGFNGVEELAFDFTTFYGWDVGDSGIGAGLITIDPATGAGTDVNPAVGGDANDVQTLGYSSLHNLLYGAWDKLYIIDRTTGEIALVGDGDYWGLRGLDYLSLDWFFPCVSKQSSLGCYPVLSGAGMSVSKSGAPVMPMVAGTVPGGATLPGILLYSKTLTSQPVQTAFGPLCLNAFQRAGAFPASPGGDEGICNGYYTWDLAAIAVGSPSIAVGDKLFFQAWYRDNGFPPPGNANLTNAIGQITVVP
jgi:hypothetical protein